MDCRALACPEPVEGLAMTGRWLGAGGWRLISFKNLPVAAFGGANAAQFTRGFEQIDLLFYPPRADAQSVRQRFGRQGWR